MTRSPEAKTPTTAWRDTYRQLLASVDDRAPQLRRALAWLFLACAVQGVALACLYPLFTAALQPSSTVWVWLAVMTALMLLATVLRWLGQNFDYDGSMLAASHALRTKLGEQLRRIPLQTLQLRRAGEINATLIGNVDENLMYTLTIVNAIFMALVTPFTAALATFIYDWRLGVLMLAVFPTLVPLTRWRRPAFARGMRQLADAQQTVSADVLEYTQGLPVLRAARATGARAQTLAASFARLQRIQTLGQQKGSKPGLVIAGVMEVGLLLIAAAGVYWALQSDLSIAVLAAALVMMVRFSEPLANFVSFTAILELIETALERVQALLAVAPLPQAAPAAVPTRHDIRFDHVSFHYDGNEQAALADVNVHIPERSMTALVGPSGSGKSTLARLVLRHFDPTAGSVQIGGVSLPHIPPDALNALVAVVFQDVYLFDDTVAANIRMARPDASDAEVRHAAQQAQCDFIERLPQGWDTRLDEAGGRLSGGERQRISIARALLKNAPILILDEPTAALDTESELAVQAAIDTLVAQKTVIVIAHRLSTIARADQILVVDDGRLVERGRHADLLQTGGRYSAMWQAQERVKRWHVKN